MDFGIITDFIEAEDKIKLSPLVFDRINYGHESDFTGLQYYFDQLDNIIIKDEYLEFTIKLTAHIKLNDGDFIFGV